ncbi:MAG TPA: hypothetical protein VJK04_03660 [Candidatus Paceibacterota bacterium]
MPQKEATSTQEFVEIERIYEDTLILKGGGLRRVLLVSGINIELKSEEEQNIIYSEYQNFLNSLDFSLQIVIHSRKLNIQNYLKMLQDREDQEADDLLKSELAEYREFIRSFVAENDIMTKNFFVVVPYDPINLPSKSTILNLLPSFISRKEPTANEAPNEISEGTKRNLFQLSQRVEHVIAGLRAIGVRAVALNKEELAELFYNLYNPESMEKNDLVFTHD